MWETILTEASTYAPRLLVAALVFGAFWLAGVVLRGVVVRVGEARGVDRYLARLFGKSVRLTMIIVGAVTALGTAGVDVTALVAGLGLTGFALGFALKDIISNMLSGILIIIYKPFTHGDQVKVAAFEGSIVDVDLRYTTLSSEGRRTFVPNSLLFTNAITVEGSAAEAPPAGDQAEENA